MRSTTTQNDQVVRVEHALTKDPREFASRLGPVASGVRARSEQKEGFRADVYAAHLRKLGLFTVRIQNAHVERPPNPYVAITVPVSGPLQFFRNREGTAFHPDSAHILHATEDLDLRIGPMRGLFVATFDEAWIDRASRRLTESQHYCDLHEDWKLDLRASAGASFRHFLDFLWAETCRGAQFTRSELAVREIEHTCTTLLILASEEPGHRIAVDPGSGFRPGALERAEEYLRENLTEPFSLDKLIAIAGTSASTLLREFRKRHGMPPLQYLKLRRLEAARRELLSAEPVEVTVTDVATYYGFYHLGRFAGYYRDTFGELPSETLKRCGSGRLT